MYKKWTELSVTERKKYCEISRSPRVYLRDAKDIEILNRTTLTKEALIKCLDCIKDFVPNYSILTLRRAINIYFIGKMNKNQCELVISVLKNTIKKTNTKGKRICIKLLWI